MIRKVRACESGSIIGLFLLLVTRVAYEKRQNVFFVVVGPCVGCVGLRVAIVADSSFGCIREVKLGFYGMYVWRQPWIATIQCPKRADASRLY